MRHNFKDIPTSQVPRSTPEFSSLFLRKGIKKKFKRFSSNFPEDEIPIFGQIWLNRLVCYLLIYEVCEVYRMEEPTH